MLQVYLVYVCYDNGKRDLAYVCDTYATAFELASRLTENFGKQVMFGDGDYTHISVRTVATERDLI